MKKTAFFWTGMVILCVLFLGTCAGPEGTGSEDIVPDSYVDYEYDGNTLKLYLDGTKVPYNSTTGRAINRDLAIMSHDLFEVVFDNTTVARTTWEIGQSAGIRGVTLGVDYGPTTAICMVGRKSDHTLLGVGILTHVNGVEDITPASVSLPVGTNNITFTITAIETSLVGPGAHMVGSTPTEIETYQDGAFQTANGAGAPYTAITANNTTVTVPTQNGGARFPRYQLPKGQAAVKATYKIVVANNAGVFVANAAKAGAFKRDPRFLNLDNGRLYYASSRIDAKTKITFDTGNTLATDSAYPAGGVFAIDFDTSKAGDGLFSFFVEIPVFGVTKDLPDITTQPGFITWYVRSGYGDNLVNLDDGNDGSGCVFVVVGTIPAGEDDMIQIFTTW